MQRTYKILVSAAETSSDLHAAQGVLRIQEELNKLGAKADFFGTTGPKLKALGVRTVVEASELLVMGGTEVLGRLPAIRRALHQLEEAAKTERPDIAIFVDYPEFHFLLAKRFKALGIRMVYFIPPKLWVWRASRIHKIRNYFEKVFLIFPFEEKFYRSHGMPARYIGNPLLEELPISLSKEEARSRLNLSAQQKVVALFFGSRPTEIDYLLGRMIDGLRSAVTELGWDRVVGLCPIPPTIDVGPIEKRIQALKKPGDGFELRVVSGDHSGVTLRAADYGIIKSGTSTLEAAILGLPHIIVYKGSWFAETAFKHLVRYHGPVGLSNLLARWEDKIGDRLKYPFPELICEQANSEMITKKFVEMVNDPNTKQGMIEAFGEIRTNLYSFISSEQESSPSQTLAKEIVSMLESPLAVQKPNQIPQKNHWFSNLMISVLWSTLNLAVRLVYAAGVLKKKKLPSRVVSVGNLEAGGTGKTPIVQAIAREGLKSGKRVLILSRGYGRKNQETTLVCPGEKVTLEQVGDEVAMLNSQIPEAWIGVGANRIHAYERARVKMGGAPDLVVLDDGYQQFGIEKDLEILCVTSRRFWEGIFRDFGFTIPLNAVLVWTKGGITPTWFNRPILPIKRSLPLTGSPQSIVLLSGVGDPKEFESLVSEAGYQVKQHMTFRDHHFFTAEEIRSALETARGLKCSLGVTSKDWVKIKTLMPSGDLSNVKVLDLVMAGSGGKPISDWEFLTP